MGNFKDKTFDYTRLSFFPFYKLDSGKSVFKFDHNYEKFTLNISFDQQLFGPVVLKSFGILDLTNDSDDYGEFIDHFFTQKKRFEKRTFYLKQEAEEIRKEIEEHDNLLKGER